MLFAAELFSSPGLTAIATLLPAVAFATVMLFTRPRPRLSAALSIGAMTLSTAAILVLLARHWSLTAPLHYAVRWMAAGQTTVAFGFLLDPASLLMLTVVALICLLVQIYSLGYMADDPGFARYYGFMSLFAAAMLSLTVSANLLQLYIFWELVGLASYLLIGFWFEKFSASEAGKKAFVMTRLGDVAFFLGILVLLSQLGNLDLGALNGPLPAQRLSHGSLTLAALLIFGGIVGKSAQFPLLTWLPDAMEGPTPVSALLHSATMVAAGVYLFARLLPFFSLSPAAMTVFLAIGTLSMLAAATMALVSRDIKRVWAYSTISQLGYMIMGLAAGGYAAGLFHLTTHAAFKALLFLCAGVFIHHFDTNDMFEIGRRGGRRLTIPMACMVLGGAALAGIPPTAGFFSKEALVGVLAQQANPIWSLPALAGVFLTAYYTFRLIFVMLFPASSAAHGEGHHGGTAAYACMAVPLLVLAAAALLLGWGMQPIVNFLGRTGLPPGGGPGHATAVLVATLLLNAAALALSWYEFGRRGAAQRGFVERLPALATFFEQRWYLDHLYRWALDTLVYRGIAALCQFNDQRMIDRGLDGLSRGTIGSGGGVSRLHASMIQYRLLIIFAVMALAGLYLVL